MTLSDDFYPGICSKPTVVLLSFGVLFAYMLFCFAFFMFFELSVLVYQRVTHHFMVNTCQEIHMIEYVFLHWQIVHICDVQIWGLWDLSHNVCALFTYIFSLLSVIVYERTLHQFMLISLQPFSLNISCCVAGSKWVLQNRSGVCCLRDAAQNDLHG